MAIKYAVGEGATAEIARDALEVEVAANEAAGYSNSGEVAITAYPLTEAQGTFQPAKVVMAQPMSNV